MTPADLPPPLADIAGCIDELDGFPVRPLILEFMALPPEDEAARARLASLIDHALSHWVSIVSRDLEEMPPLTTKVMEDISGHMRATRAALVEVRAQFRRLSKHGHRAPASGSDRPLALTA